MLSRPELAHAGGGFPLTSKATADRIRASELRDRLQVAALGNTLLERVRQLCDQRGQEAGPGSELHIGINH